mmetsp:Transcript_8606/g.10683  ORF Transcript_8606/g.10683 Transcript_8606/m.10683 type:complete len:174 (+) Transcript_8606:86-607(+)
MRTFYHSITTSTPLILLYCVSNNTEKIIICSNMETRKAYVDPSTLMAYDTNNADYEGWLTKRSVWLREWRRRYFILKGNHLFFSKSTSKAPHGMIDLKNCLTVKSAEEKTRRPHSLVIKTPDETYYCFADTEREKDDWIGAVGKAIVRASATYTNEDGYGSDGSDEDNDEFKR